MASQYKKGYTDKITTEYIKNNYDQFSLRMPKGAREKYKEFAKSQGMSLNGLILELLDNQMKSVREDQFNKRIIAYADKLVNTGLSVRVIDSISEIAKKNDIDKVVLFGSRARGDFYRASDIDLAAHGGNINRFRIDLEEDVPTLLTFDVVDLDGNPSRSILDTIDKEGRVLYEAI